MIGTQELSKKMVNFIVKEIMSESDCPELFSYDTFWQSVKLELPNTKKDIIRNIYSSSSDSEDYSMFDATSLMFKLIELIVLHPKHFAEEEQKQAVEKIAEVFSFDLSRSYYGNILKKRIVGKSLEEILNGSNKEIIKTIKTALKMKEILKQMERDAYIRQSKLDEVFNNMSGETPHYSSEESKSEYETGSSSHEWGERERTPYGSSSYQQDDKGKEKAGSSKSSGFWQDSSSHQQKQGSDSSSGDKFEQETAKPEKQESSEQPQDPKLQNYSSKDMTEEQAYKILGAPKGTPIKKVKKLRDAFLLIYHTDTSDNAENEKNKLVTQNINNAYEFLSNIAEKQNNTLRP